MPSDRASLPVATPLQPLPLEYASASPMSHVRWVILALVFFGTTINYVDRLVMTILAPELKRIYQISPDAYGDIQAAFAWAYALGQLASGAWLDRVGTRFGYAIALAAWSVVSAFHAVVHTAFGFGVARALLGVTESPNFPAAAKTIAEWFPKRERALAMGIVNSGSTVGAIIAPIMVPLLAARGWQWAFIGTATLGVVWLILWIPLYRRPQEHPGVSAAELAHINSDPAEPVAHIRWITLLSYPQAWAFVASKFLTDSIWWFYMSWFANFLNDHFGLSLTRIGLPMAVVFVMAGFGSIGGGWISTAMLKRGHSLNRSRKTALFICAVCVVPIVFAANCASLWTAVLLLGLATAAHQGFSSNQYTLISDMFPRRAVASVAGLGGTFGYFGAAIYSHLTGRILRWTGGGYIILFIIAGSAYLLAFALIQLFAPRLQPACIDDDRPGFPVIQ